MLTKEILEGTLYTRRLPVKPNPVDGSVMGSAVGIAVGARETEVGFGVGVLRGTNVGNVVGVGDKTCVHKASELCRKGKDDVVRQEGRHVRPELL